MSCGSDFEKGFVAVEAIAESPRQQEVEGVVRHGVPAMWHQAATPTQQVLMAAC